MSRSARPRAWWRSRAFEAFDDVEEVDVAARLAGLSGSGVVGADDDVAALADGEVALAPCVDVVGVEGVLDAPRLGRVVLQASR